MNSRMPHLIFRRTVSTGRRPALGRVFFWTALFVWAGLILPVSSPVLGLPALTSVSRPEYIYTPPQSGVQNDTDDYKVSVEFAWNIGSTEPVPSSFPVVYWYRNGNYIASVVSTFKNKTTSATGVSYYDCWDPYADSGRGFAPTGSTPNGNTRQILWKNELAVSLKDAGASKTAVYVAYIPVLDATTTPAQIVLSPAQILGQPRPTLTVVRSPESATIEAAGAVTLWGDALSHANSLLRNPFGVTLDSKGMIYVADSLNHTIRRVTPGGKATTIAGLDGAILDTATGKRLVKTTQYDPVLSQLTGEIVDGASVPALLRMSSVEDLVIGSRLVITGGSVSTQAGVPTTVPTGTLTVSSINTQGGSIATTTSLGGVTGTLTFNVKDSATQRAIYLERPPTKGAPFMGDMISNQDSKDSNSYRFKSVTSTISEPLFNTPEAVAAADDGSIFVADTENGAIRRIYYDEKHKTHVQTLCAGTQQYVGAISAGTWGTLQYSNPSNLASGTVELTAPRGIIFQGSMLDTTGTNAPTLYVLDFKSIQKITLNYKGENGAVNSGSWMSKVSYIGSVSQVEGWQGDAEAARLYAPRGLVVTKEAKEGGGDRRVIYIADTVNHVIRKLSLKTADEDVAAPSDWTSEIVAGLVGSKGTSANADGSTGYYPPVILADCNIAGGTWISVASTEGILPNDSVSINGGTYTVNRVESGSLITTAAVIGSGSYGASIRRAPSPQLNLSRLTYPSGITMDRKNNLYFTEMGSHNVRRVIMDDANPGVITRVETVAGQSQGGPTDGGSGDGIGTAAAFSYPAAIVYDTTGTQENFLLADSGNHCIRRLVLSTKQVFVTGVGEMAAPTKITNLSSMAGIQPLMRVGGVNIPRGAYVVRVDVPNKTVTLNLPIIGTIDGTQKLVLEQDSFTSSTVLGYTGFAGNRDFASECAEYTYQWTKYGISLSDDTNVSGADDAFLSLSNVRSKDSGPYQLTISNVFNISAKTNQAAVYVVPKLDQPAFLTPGYSQLSVSGTSALTQLRGDQGDMSFLLRTYITPADSVSYQWQVFTAGSGWVSLNDSSKKQITNTEVAQLLGTDGYGGLVLEGTTTPNLKVSGYQKSLVNRGAALPSVNFRVQAFPLSGGTMQVTLDQSGVTVGSFTSSAAFSPVLAGTLTAVKVYDSPISPPPAGTLVPLTDEGKQAKFDQTRFDNGGTIRLTLKAQDDVAAFPRLKGEDKYNPEFRLRYQWIKSTTTPDDLQASFTIVPESTKDFTPGVPPTLELDFDGEPAFYCVRYWVGSGVPEDENSSTVVGSPLIGNWVRLTKAVAASAGTIYYAVGPADGEPEVKVVYVNAPQESFTLDALIDAASGTPVFTWSYLPWGLPTTIATTTGTLTAGASQVRVASSTGLAVGQRILSKGIPEGTTITKILGKTLTLSDTATLTASGTLITTQAASLSKDRNWKTLKGGTVSSSGIFAGTYGWKADRLGSGSVSATLTSASLSLTSFEKLPDLKTGSTPTRDLSGLYRLQAVVKDGFTTSAPVEKYWVVAARQKPSVYGTDEKIYSLNGGPQTLLAVGGSVTSGTMAANVLLPSPDKIPMHAIYGSTLIDGVSDSLILSSSDQFSMSESEMYSWYKGTTPVSAGKNTIISGGTLKITNIQDRDLGTYTLRVANKCGMVTNLGPSTTTAAGVSMKGWSIVTNGLPTFLANPSAKVTEGMVLTGTLSGGTLVYRAAQGQTIALEVPVQSSFGLTYSWSFSKTGPNGPWETKSTAGKDSKYFIRAATLDQSGWYRVNVQYSAADPLTKVLKTYNSRKEADWPKLKLVVEPMPDPAIPKLTAIGSTVSTSGGVKTLVAGGTAKLEAVNSSGGSYLSLSSGTTSFFTYQWRKNGVPLIGQDSGTLTLSKLTKSQAGSYTVDVSGAAGTKTSAPLVLAVTSKSSVEVNYSVGFVNLQDIKYTISPSIANKVPAGTPVTLTGMSSSTQTLLGWRIWDALGNSWDLPARGAQFTMPASDVTIAPTVGRPSIGSYTGFLSLEKPWGDLEWDIYALLGRDSAQKRAYSQAPNASMVRGYFQAMISSLGVVSGKVLIEGKSYPFTSNMALAPDGSYSGSLKIEAALADRTPWVLTGTMSLNMGLRKTCKFNAGATSMTLSTVSSAGGTAGLVETMSVSGYGIPEGTIITGIGGAHAGPITVSNKLTKSTSAMNPAGVPVVFGAEMAALDNVMHVKLNDVVLELTPPVMKSGRTLYSVAAGNAGVYKSLSKFITAKTGQDAPRNPSYTAAVYRFGIKDASSVFGRGGVLSTNISDLGYAIITGYLPNGAKLSFAGYGGRACYVQSTRDSDPLEVFSPTDGGGGTDAIGIAVGVMQETLERHTSSISIPIWSTSPSGDKPEEPLFGALIISDLSVHGCLGVLNAVPLATGTFQIGNVTVSSGSFATASEYTHNYVNGYLYDPTVDPNWPKPNPFTPSALVSLYSSAPSADATSYPLEELTTAEDSTTTPITSSDLGTKTALGILDSVGRGFGFTASLAANPLVSSFSIAVDAPTGLFSGSFVENTSRYVKSTFSGPDWASADTPSRFRMSLTARFYAVTIQGGDSSVLGTAGGATGFLIRGTTKADSLKNTLGNGYQDPWVKDSKSTFRTEALNLNVYEPN